MITNMAAIGISDFLVQAGAALLAWGLLALVSYVCAVWCFSYDLAWRSALRSAGLVIGGLVLTLALFYLFSSMWAEITTTIILPTLVCIVALHAFLLMLKEFLARRAPLHVRTTRFYATLVVLYVLFIGSCGLVIHVRNVYLCQSFALVLNYFIYAAALGIFLLSLSNHRHDESY